MEPRPTDLQLDRFACLGVWPGFDHAFTTRLTPSRQRRHADDRDLLSEVAPHARRWRFVRQVHGADVAVVDERSEEDNGPADALCTCEPGVALVISVADCCAVYVVDPVRRGVGLAHSGRKGTEQNVTGALIRTMRERLGSEPSDLVVQLSPCIRPPHYETNFAATIVRQAEAAGVGTVADGGVCTGARVDRYFSYRLERGDTGRMAAVALWRERTA